MNIIHNHLANGIAQIQIDRERAANALSAQMLADLVGAVGESAGSAALILTGTGRVFSAGADLSEVNGGSGNLATDPNWEVLSQQIADFPGLTIAALNGTVAGGAMGMVLACDIRLAVPNTKFFYPALAKGVDPQPSDPGRCAQLIGPSRTAEFFVLGRKIEAETALAWGLINRIVQPDELEQDAMDCALIAGRSDAARLARIKSMIRG